MKTLLVIIIFAGSLCVSGQDLHFSQYNEHHPLVNPALIGAADNLRITGGYRNQWKAAGAPFKTFGASVEIRGAGRKKRVGRFGFSRTRRTSRLAVGFSVYKDEAGDGAFANTHGNLALATFIKTSDKSFISVGFQGGIVQAQMSPAGFVFPNQFNGAGYDPSIPSEENGLRAENFNYADMSAGIAWSYGESVKGFTDQREVKIRTGFSAYHLNNPKLPFRSGSQGTLQRRYVGHAEVIFTIFGSSKYSLAPSLLYQVQGAQRELIGGAMIRYYHRHDTRYTGYLKRTTVGLGLFYRNNDAAVTSLLIEVQEMYAVGISYDVSISQLRTATIRGGLEIALRYTPAGAFLYQRR